MNNKLLCNVLVLVCVLTACTASGPAATSPAQADSPATPALTISPTLPSETPLPPPTIIMTPTLTSIPSPTPENFVLAESGFDFADVRVVNVQADTVRVEFKYRIDPDYVLKYHQRFKVMLVIPAACRPKNSENPSFDIADPVGTGALLYNQRLPSRCSLPFFDLIVEIINRIDSTDVLLKEVYRERIRQPLEVTGNLALVDSKSLTVKNIEFHRTGNWSGDLTFDYAFGPEVSIDSRRYRFELSAGAVVRACSFWTFGPLLDSPAGKYTLSISLTSVDEPACLAGRDSFSYEGAAIVLRDRLTDAEPYSHAVGFPITIRKAP